MTDTSFTTDLKRGKVTSVTLDIAFPDGSTDSVRIDTKGTFGGILFDDGVLKDLVQARIEAGGTHWAEALPLWDPGTDDWTKRPAFLLLPTVQADRCGPGNCPAAKDGQCVNGGTQCG